MAIASFLRRIAFERIHFAKRIHFDKCHTALVCLQWCGVLKTTHFKTNFQKFSSIQDADQLDAKHWNEGVWIPDRVDSMEQSHGFDRLQHGQG